MSHAISNAGSLEARYYFEVDRDELRRQRYENRKRQLEAEHMEDPKCLYNALGDNEALLEALCEALYPRIRSYSKDPVTLAVQNISNDAIKRQLKREFPDYRGEA